jgi:hypothetical protein
LAFIASRVEEAANEGGAGGVYFEPSKVKKMLMLHRVAAAEPLIDGRVV